MLASLPTTRSFSLRLSLLVALFGSASCFFEDDDEPSEGTLVVPFELGNRRSCKSFGVKEVRGELNDGDYIEEVSCDLGEVRFRNVKAGTYRVRLFGLDQDGVAVMDNRQDNDTALHVIGDGTTVEADRPIKLTASPAHLFLRWSFGFGSCKSASIDRFAIEVWRDDGGELLLETEVDCETDGEGPEGYRQVTDDGLASEQVGEVSVQPLDEGGEELGDPVLFELDSPSTGRDIELTFNCVQSVCCEGTEACEGLEDEDFESQGT
jgi:hypothetical protein